MCLKVLMGFVVGLPHFTGLIDVEFCLGAEHRHKIMVKEDKAKSFAKCFHGDKTYKTIPFQLGNRKNN